MPLLSAVFITSSCLSFAVGAVVPLLSAVFITSSNLRVGVTAGASLVSLAVCGIAGSIIGGAAPWVGAVRVTSGGAIALDATYEIGRAIGG